MNELLAIESALRFEADRFKQLAYESAARHFITPSPENERRTRDHYLRAATFRAAVQVAQKARGAR